MLNVEEFIARHPPQNNDDRHDAVVTADHEDSLDACRESALRLLDAAPRSSGALRARLVDKGYEAPVVDDVLSRFTQHGTAWHRYGVAAQGR